MFYNIINDYLETIIAIKSSYVDMFVILTYYKNIKKISIKYRNKEFFKEYFTSTVDYFYTEDNNLEVFIEEKEMIKKEINKNLKIYAFNLGITKENEHKIKEEIIEILNFIFEKNNKEIDIYT